MRTGVFLNKLFINHTTFFQTNKDKSYIKKETEPFAYKTVNHSVCNIRGCGVTAPVVFLAAQLTFTNTSAHMYWPFGMNEMGGGIVRPTLVVTNSYNKCLTKSLEFFLPFFCCF